MSTTTIIAGSFGWRIPMRMMAGATPLDISGADTLEITLFSADGTKYGPFAATLTSGGVDGYMHYDTVLNDLPANARPGVYKRRAHAALAGVYDLTTDDIVGAFTVKAPW